MISKLALLLLLPVSTLASFNLLSLPDGGDLPEIPAGTPENPACVTAYNATIDCDVEIVSSTFSGDNLPTEASLNRICTSTCLNSLRSWIRGGEGCEGETFLNYFGLMADNFFDAGLNYTIADVQQYYITATYHSKCLVDLKPQPNQSKYCLLNNSTSQSSIYNTSDPDSLCVDNTCGTQAAYVWAPVKVIYEYNITNITLNPGASKGDLPMVSLEEACPNLDTSGFPTLEADITASQLSNSSGNGTKSNNNGGSSGNGTKTNTPNSAVGGAMVERTAVFAVILGVAGYLLL